MDQLTEVHIEDLEQDRGILCTMKKGNDRNSGEVKLQSRLSWLKWSLMFLCFTSILSISCVCEIMVVDTVSIHSLALHGLK